MKNIDIIMGKLSEFLKEESLPAINLLKKQTNDPLKILIATMLSARTKDTTTLKVSEKLFSFISTLKELEEISEEKLSKLLYPIGFYKQKAKYLKKWPKILKKDYQNEIPRNLKDLTKLPGVGRKTANLVLGIAFNIPSICVDTHVHRIINRLGLTKTKTPLETEMSLRKILAKKYWIKINTYLVRFGQIQCKPINPKCDVCIIQDYCQKNYEARSFLTFFIILSISSISPVLL